jgi:hypothetical protein
LTLNYFAKNIDTILLGKIVGSELTGNYNRNLKLSRFICGMVGNSVGSVIFPFLTESQKNLDELYTKFLKICKLLFLLGTYISALGFCASRELISIYYGSQWTHAIMPLKYSSLSIVFIIMFLCATQAYRSVGATKIMFKFSLFHTMIVVAFIIIAVTTGDITSVAICNSIAYIVDTTIYYFILVSVVLKQSIFKYSCSMLPFFGIYLINILVGLFISDLFTGNVFYTLTIKALILGVITMIMLLVTGQHKLLTNLVHGMKFIRKDKK